MPAAQAFWLPAQVHRGRHVGDTEIHGLSVESKGARIGLDDGVDVTASS
jgi:hypothetical protein